MAHALNNTENKALQKALNGFIANRYGNGSDSEANNKLIQAIKLKQQQSTNTSDVYKKIEPMYKNQRKYIVTNGKSCRVETRANSFNGQNYV